MKKKNLVGSLGSAMKKLGDVRLNKSGTIGTEPVAVRNKKGGYTRGTEIKIGPLGKVFVPSIKKKR